MVSLKKGSIKTLNLIQNDSNWLAKEYSKKAMFYYVKSLELLSDDSIPKIKLQEVKDCINFL